MAAVIPRDGAQIDEQAVLQAVRRMLAAHEVPKELHVVGQLPRTAEGKLRRQALRSHWPPR